MDLEFTTNYLSYFHLTVTFLSHLQSLSQSQETPASLIYNTSALGLIPIPRCANYCASKAALHQLILSLRVQLKDVYPNLKIIEILPPAVQTELHDAKHQPDLKEGGKLGMPLGEFTDAAWLGLERGEEQIPIGMAKMAYERFENARQEVFMQIVERLGSRP
jgi:short-subunit dehydrogenase involved in D-alanine esterification of teichoic acids